ncbi:MAG: PIN domain-containing protein [Eubacteriales bacterium]
MIRVFLDTNVLLSGLMFNGPEHRVLQLACRKKIQLILGDYVIREAKAVIGRKFPGQEIVLELFLNQIDYETVPFPTKGFTLHDHRHES